MSYLTMLSALTQKIVRFVSVLKWLAGRRRRRCGRDRAVQGSSNTWVTVCLYD